VVVDGDGDGRSPTQLREHDRAAIGVQALQAQHTLSSAVAFARLRGIVHVAVAVNDHVNVDDHVNGFCPLLPWMDVGPHGLDCP
jgi:hypothetical protein